MTKIGDKIKCDFCGGSWVSTSPPSEESYESQRVQVKEMSVLLPQRVVDLYHRTGYSDSHALFIWNQDFCDILCLVTYVHQYMKGKGEVNGM